MTSGCGCTSKDMLLADILILFISTSSVFGVGWHTPSPIIFGQVGQNVTLTVKATGSLSAFTWYRQKHNGKIDMVCSGQMCNSPSHHVAGMSDISEGFLTIINTSVTDSGSYFAVSKLSKLHDFQNTSCLNLAVIDDIPHIRLFYGSGSAKTHVFKCEITGAGAGWSSLHWKVTENGQLREMEGVGGGEIGLGADGSFTRWSVVTVGPEKSFSITCLCRHNHTGVVVQTNTVDMSKGASLCLLISGLTLACLPLLLTLVVLSAWRTCKQRGLTIDG